jgi:hypothetical protein
MIKHYTFDYNIYDAEASFKVDTEKFTEEIAKECLNFFTWDYDKQANPIDEILKKYAMEAIRVSTFNTFNLKQVIAEFKYREGFCRVDGTLGIELMTIKRYEFDEDNLSMEVVND